MSTATAIEGGHEAGPPRRTIALTVNGRSRSVECEDRQLLVEVVREQLNLKGTHVGCLNGDCGACTLELNGQIVKSCLLLAASAEGCEVNTVDGMGTPEELAPVQEAFWDNDGFQCGFCLPGHLFAARDLIASNPDPSDEEIRQAIAGNLCRCTGYQSIVNSIHEAAARARADQPEPDTAQQEAARLGDSAAPTTTATRADQR